MKIVCQKDLCTGCMACVEICPVNAIQISDTLVAYNAMIDTEKCIGCNRCHNICQNNRMINFNKPIEWHQGWAKDEKIRAQASSGGVASALMREFVGNGGYVCSCRFQNGKFLFSVTDSEGEIASFRGSKYVKSNPQGVYRQIKDLLKSGHRVLFIGLPCQVSAVKTYAGEELQENLYTIDLICHGTPSPKLFDLFLRQYKLDPTHLKSVSFRSKDKFSILGAKSDIGTPGVTDSYSISFLNGVNYTENCYQCKYAKLGRCSDITLGDSWGSELSQEERNKGISLILCQTQKGMQLLNQSGIDLFEVDLENAIKNNKQLSAPCPKSEKRERFFQALQHGKSYNKIILKLYPKQTFRQWLKKVLIKTRIIARGGGYSIQLEKLNEKNRCINVDIQW